MFDIFWKISFISRVVNYNSGLLAVLGALAALLPSRGAGRTTCRMLCLLGDQGRAPALVGSSAYYQPQTMLQRFSRCRDGIVCKHIMHFNESDIRGKARALNSFAILDKAFERVFRNQFIAHCFAGD